MENDKRITRLENDMSKVKDEVQELHKNTAVSKQEIKMIFNILNEIKDSIKDIAKDLGNLKEKPADRWESVVTTLDTYSKSKESYLGDSYCFLDYRNGSVFLGYGASRTPFRRMYGTWALFRRG